MKIHFLCEHYPGEWILSLAARTRRAISMDSALSLVRSLFGMSRISLGLALVENKSNLEGSLRHLSLLNFITSFVPGKAKRIEIANLVGNGAYNTVAYQLGRAGSRRLGCHFLRYCSECARTQIERFGEPFWLRLPQIRGINFCPIHKAAYVDSPISRQHPGNLHALSSIHSKYLQTREPSNNQEMAQYLLAEAAAGLLNAEPGWNADWINRAWTRLLKEYGGSPTSLGLASSLSHDLCDRYGNAYLESSGCGVGTKLEYSWITRFIRNPSQETDPLRHLLILGLGNNTIADLTKAASTEPIEATADTGRESCENPICVNIGASWEGTSRSFRCRHTRKQIRHATCQKCKQTIAHHSDTETGVTKAWIVDRGDLWKLNLTKMWTDQTLSLRELSRRLGADPLTAARHAAKLGLNFPRHGKHPTYRIPVVAAKITVAPQSLSRRRTRWVAALKRTRSQSKARRIEPATYAWLRRNDHRWLRENRPTQNRKANSGRPRVDWAVREALFLARLPLARERVLNRVPSKRCSTQLLAREVGAEGMLKYLHQMPTFDSKLRSLAESRADFATRRLAPR